jgi:hypothetical protein
MSVPSTVVWRTNACKVVVGHRRVEGCARTCGSSLARLRPAALVEADLRGGPHGHEDHPVSGPPRTAGPSISAVA